MLVGAAPPTGASIREYGLEAIGRFCSQGTAAVSSRFGLRQRGAQRNQSAIGASAHYGRT